MIKVTIRPDTVNADLDPNDRTIAVLSGEITLAFQEQGIEHLRGVYQALRSFQSEGKVDQDGTAIIQLARHPNSTASTDDAARPAYSAAYNGSRNPSAYDPSQNPSAYHPPQNASAHVASPPLLFNVCLADMADQLSCRGELVDRQGIAQMVQLEFALLNGKHKVATLSLPLSFACVEPLGAIGLTAGYLEGQTGFGISLLAYNHNASFWAAFRSLYPAEDATRAIITAKHLILGQTNSSAPQLARLESGGLVPHGVCLSGSGPRPAGTNIVVSNDPRPIRRYFYLTGPRDMIERVDGIQPRITMTRVGLVQ